MILWIWGLWWLVFYINFPGRYQLIQSDLRFSAIMNEQNFLKFNYFFEIETRSVNTCNMALDRLAVSRAKHITEKSFFRVQEVANDAADLHRVSE